MRYHLLEPSYSHLSYMKQDTGEAGLHCSTAWQYTHIGRQRPRGSGCPVLLICWRSSSPGFMAPWLHVLRGFMASGHDLRFERDTVHKSTPMLWAATTSTWACMGTIAAAGLHMLPRSSEGPACGMSSTTTTRRLNHMFDHLVRACRASSTRWLVPLKGTAVALQCVNRQTLPWPHFCSPVLLGSAAISCFVLLNLAPPPCYLLPLPSCC